MKHLKKIEIYSIAKELAEAIIAYENDKLTKEILVRMADIANKKLRK